MCGYALVYSTSLLLTDTWISLQAFYISNNFTTQNKVHSILHLWKCIFS